MLLNWGIIGAGHICSDFVSALKTLPADHHQAVAVAARDVEKASKFAAKYLIKTVHLSYEELAKDENIDVVYIGITNIHHHAVAKMLLNHGKHILCEKPLAINSREVKELINLAKEKSLFLMQAIWSRCFPVYAKLCKTIDSGIIGDVVYIECKFGKECSQERHRKKSLGAGSLLDLGIYGIQFLTFVLRQAKPTKIAAFCQLNDDGVDNATSVIFQFPNGSMASVNSSMVTKYQNEATVYGSKGKIKVCEPFWCPTRIIINSEAEDFPLPCLDMPTNFTNSAGLSYEAEEVRRCLMQGLIESPLISNSDSELITQIMDEIRSQGGVEYEADIA